MLIRPATEIKPFNKCAPGELVRLPYRSSPLAFVATGQDGTTLFQVRLEHETRGIFPTYFLIKQDDQLEQEVISYGTDYVIDVVQGAQFEFGDQKLTNTPGALWLHSADWFMFVAAASPELGPGYYQLGSATLGRGPQSNNSARFAHWTLNVPSTNPMRPSTLVQFEYKLEK